MRRSTGCSFFSGSALSCSMTFIQWIFFCVVSWTKGTFWHNCKERKISFILELCFYIQPWIYPFVLLLVGIFHSFEHTQNIREERMKCNGLSQKKSLNNQKTSCWHIFNFYLPPHSKRDYFVIVTRGQHNYVILPH